MPPPPAPMSQPISQTKPPLINNINVVNVLKTETRPSPVNRRPNDQFSMSEEGRLSLERDDGQII